jgi:hypothetical protein
MLTRIVLIFALILPLGALARISHTGTSKKPPSLA